MRTILFILFFLVGTVFLLEDSDEGIDKYDHAYFEAMEAKRHLLKEGDIISENQNPGVRNNAVSNHSLKWPNAKVAIKYSPKFNDTEKALLTYAMREIEEKTCVRFRFKTPDDGDVIMFGKPTDEVKCSSMVGRRGGEQPLFLGVGCLDRRTILHEIMHALGFVHEHNRPDREKYVTINLENIHPELKGQFVQREYDELDKKMMYTKYAYESIMHYRANQAAIDKSIDTIIPKKRNVQLGGGNGLSDIDVERINLYYDCPERTTHVKATDPPIGPQPPSPKLEWKTENGITWSNGCTFETGNTHRTTTKAQCGRLCKDFGNCDHFSWISRIGTIGRCSLMANYNIDISSKITSVDSACGIIPDKVNTETLPPPTETTTTDPPKINWINSNGVTWSNYCSFETTKSFTFATREACGPYCKGFTNCDHFTWIGNVGDKGKCYLMAGYDYEMEAELASSNYACGIIPDKVNTATDPPTPAPPSPEEFGLDDSWTCEQDGSTVDCEDTGSGRRCHFHVYEGGYSSRCPYNRRS